MRGYLQCLAYACLPFNQNTGLPLILFQRLLKAAAAQAGSAICESAIFQLSKNREDERREQHKD
jgi:hypothetical protein